LGVAVNERSEGRAAAAEDGDRQFMLELDLPGFQSLVR
jgi:hypothetical protein